MKIIEKSIQNLLPYEKNPRKNDDAVQYVEASIREFGFRIPIIIDKNGVIVCGHTRYKAAKKMGMKTVPCIAADDLTPEQIKAFRIADNQTAEMSKWDPTLLLDEIGELTIDMEQFGFNEEAFEEAKELENEWFEAHESGELTDEDSEEYEEFLDKFKPKRTTDDCYTPRRVYEAVAKWVSEEYKIDRSLFVRPFYPGGDYKKEKYPTGCAVVDNPPFSIFAEILNFYQKKKIKFFLFGPTLTLFSSQVDNMTAIPTGVCVTYENKAKVNTSFVTNMEPEKTRIRTAPSLYEAVKKANEEEQKELNKEIQRYLYPDEVITAAMVAKWTKYGIDFKVSEDESEKIAELDEQKKAGKAIYGKAFIVSERAAAERAAAERAAAERAAAERAAAERAAARSWKLSEREKQIVKRLSANS